MHMARKKKTEKEKGLGSDTVGAGKEFRRFLEVVCRDWMFGTEKQVVPVYSTKMKKTALSPNFLFPAVST